MNAPNPMLWHEWRGRPLDGWLVSEKLDGVRGYWDGAALWTRGGRKIAAPASFTAGLPAQALDGEIYAGVGTLARVQGLVRRKVATEADWLGVRFCVFDLPEAAGGFVRRLAALQALFSSGAVRGPVECVAHEVLADENRLARLFASIRARGGEGLVARCPESLYQPGVRSGRVLKIKEGPGNPLCAQGFAGAA